MSNNTYNFAIEVELFVCWSDGTWTDNIIIELTQKDFEEQGEPSDSEIAEEAEQKFFAERKRLGLDDKIVPDSQIVAHVGMASYTWEALRSDERHFGN